MVFRAIMELSLAAPLLAYIVTMSLLTIVSGTTPCSSGSYLGFNSVSSVANSIGTGFGRQFLMTDSEFVSNCCGFVTQWEVFANNANDIVFQVWRPSGGSYTLAGENSATTTGYGTNLFPVTTSDQIAIQSNDVIGWYTNGSDLVRHKTGGSRNNNNYVETIDQPSIGDVLIFVNRETRRDFALKAHTGGGNSPSFTNLDAAVSFYKTTISSSSYLVYTVTATDSDALDTLTYSITSQSPSNDFAIDSSSGSVTTVTSAVSITTYTVNIRVTDSCGNAVDGTLTVEIINRSPEIYSLPAVAHLSESTVDETLLHTVNTSDPDGDVITCSLSSSPSGPFITKFILSGGSLASAVYVGANPSFDYTTVNTYELTVTCVDPSSASASGIVYVYITQNSVPVISNLQNSTAIQSTIALYSIVFNVFASDPEGDQILFTLTCVTAVSLCPFDVYSDGSIALTTSLLGTSINAYELDISVADVYSSSGTHRLTVFVQDLNVVPHLINLPAYIQVTEDTAVGTTIFDADAYDGNGDLALTFSAFFNPASSASLFNINATNGEVILTSNLLYASQPNNYTLTITVFDGLDSSSSQTLQIEITPINRAPVLYQYSYQVEASEGNAGTSFPDPGYNVHDVDGDVLTYSFGGGNSSAGFAINSSTGIVSYSIAFDVDDPDTVTSYVWLIAISDPEGLSTTATLTVSMNDVNDNVPAFSSSHYSASVPNDVIVGSSVMRVSSTDSDITSVHRVKEYSKTGTNYFGITNDGDILVQTNLTNLVGTTQAFVIYVKNPGTGNYYRDTSSVTITIYATSEDSFFDSPANIAWVTLACVMAPAIVVGLAFLGYKLWTASQAAVRPVHQVAPYETNLPKSPRPVSQLTQVSSISERSTATPSDIRVIDSTWQAWNQGQSAANTLWAP